MCVCTYAYVYVCVYIYIYNICATVCSWTRCAASTARCLVNLVYIYIYIYIYMYVHIYVCVYIYITLCNIVQVDEMRGQLSEMQDKFAITEASYRGAQMEVRELQRSMQEARQQSATHKDQISQLEVCVSCMCLCMYVRRIRNRYHRWRCACMYMYMRRIRSR
jgi:hypothetical protein